VLPLKKKNNINLSVDFLYDDFIIRMTHIKYYKGKKLKRPKIDMWCFINQKPIHLLIKVKTAKKIADTINKLLKDEEKNEY